MAALAILGSEVASRAASPDGLVWSARTSGTTDNIQHIRGSSLDNVIFNAGIQLYQYDAEADAWGSLASWESFRPTIPNYNITTKLTSYAVGDAIWVGSAAPGSGSNEVARFNGTNWQYIGTGTGNPVRALYSTGDGATDTTLAGRNSGRLSRFTGSIHNGTGNSATGAAEIRAISGTGSDNLWAVGNSGTVERSVDGGATWSLLAAPTTGNLLGISVLSDQIAIVAGSAGAVSLTTNGGLNWVSLGLGGEDAVRDIYAESLDRIWVVGVNGLASFYNGSSWTSFADQLDGLGTTHLSSITYVEGHFWIGGDNGVLYHAVVPEPSSIALMAGVGVVVVLLRRRRR